MDIHRSTRRRVAIAGVILGIAGVAYATNVRPGLAAGRVAPPFAGEGDVAPRRGRVRPKPKPVAEYRCTPPQWSGIRVDGCWREPTGRADCSDTAKQRVADMWCTKACGKPKALAFAVDWMKVQGTKYLPDAYHCPTCSLALTSVTCGDAPPPPPPKPTPPPPPKTIKEETSCPTWDELSPGMREKCEDYPTLPGCPDACDIPPAPPQTPSPTMTRFDPPAGRPGSSVTIFGTNLRYTTMVLFNGERVEGFSSSADGTTLQTLVPYGSTSGRIEIRGSTSSDESGTDFLVWTGECTDANITKAFDQLGLTLSGSKNNGQCEPKQYGNYGTFRSLRRIIRDRHGDRYAGKYTPKVTAASPASATGGARVYLRGNGFLRADEVKVADRSLAFTRSVSGDGTEVLTVELPRDLRGGKVEVSVVSDLDGTHSFQNILTFVDPIQLQEVRPGTAEPGGTVRITGSALYQVTRMKFGNRAVAVQASPTEVTATVPLDLEGTFPLTLETTSGTTIAVLPQYTVRRVSKVTITSIDPEAQWLGKDAIIRGSGFSAVTEVRFNTESIGFTRRSDSEITIPVSWGMAPNWTVELVARGGGYTSSALYSPGRPVLYLNRTDAQKTEACYGGVGKGCYGSEDKPEEWGWGSQKVIVPVGCSNTANGKRNCWVVPGSIKHDNCCARYPSGKMCGGPGRNPWNRNEPDKDWLTGEVKPAGEDNHDGHCVDEWHAAFWDVFWWRAFVGTFDVTQPSNIASAESHRYRLKNPEGRFIPGEAQETLRLCAPAGHELREQNDEGFCCSRRAVEKKCAGGRATQRLTETSGVPVGIITRTSKGADLASVPPPPPPGGQWVTPAPAKLPARDSRAIDRGPEYSRTITPRSADVTREAPASPEPSSKRPTAPSTVAPTSPVPPASGPTYCNPELPKLWQQGCTPREEARPSEPAPTPAPVLAPPTPATTETPPGVPSAPRAEPVPPASGPTYCNPELPKLWQEGCVDRPSTAPATETPICNPNVPRYTQPGCREARRPSSRLVRLLEIPVEILLSTLSTPIRAGDVPPERTPPNATIPHVRLSPETTAQGRELTIRATGFAPLALLTITIDGIPFSRANDYTNSGGDLVKVLTVPTTMANGQHEVVVSDPNGNIIRSTLTILGRESYPSVRLRPDRGVAGTSVQILGGSWTRSTKTVTLAAANGAATPLPLAYDRCAKEHCAEGELDVGVAIPEGTVAGSYAIAITDGIGQAFGVFTVVPRASFGRITKPTIVALPNHGRPGTYVTIAGAGFRRETVVFAQLDGERLPIVKGAFRTDTDGSFDGAIVQVPEVKPGPHTITIADGAGGRTKVVFTVDAEEQDDTPPTPTPIPEPPTPTPSPSPVSPAPLPPLPTPTPEPPPPALRCNLDLPRFWQPACATMPLPVPKPPMEGRPCRTDLAITFQPGCIPSSPTLDPLPTDPAPCDPSIPRYRQPGCRRPEPSPISNPFDGKPCVSFLPRVWQSGCVDRSIPSPVRSEFEGKPCREDLAVTFQQGCVSVPRPLPELPNMQGKLCNPNVPKYRQPGCVE